MNRRRSSVLLLLLVPALAMAQAPPRRPPQGVAAVAGALLQGRYDEAAALADKLDLKDPAVAALKARALIARGRYGEAEAMLGPVVDRAPTSAAALEFGLLQQMLSRPGATTVLTRVSTLAVTSTDALDLARAARALQALGRFQEANAAYRDATSLIPDDPAINTGWGELFLEKHNNSEALKSFQEALKADERYAPAMSGLARSLAEDNPPQAIAIAKKVLEVNPSAVDMHVLMAEEAADASQHAEARTAIEKALAVNPSSLEALALLAAITYVEDRPKDFEAEVAKALAVAPKYGEVYRASGELAAHNYRFDEAVELTRRALALDPDNPRALADLGTHLLRTGDETGARAALEASFKLDPFNVSTFNQLGMLDTVDKFETFRDGDLIVRLHKDEAAVLKEYAIDLSRKALDTLSAKYKFKPKGPFLIEVFPKHDDFAVRTIGLPGMVGATGVCFGRVVALDSPRARPPGTYQWESTLWHELAHVITIQMSKQRVPRWLTEGVSVYEEGKARPEWGRQQDVQFAAMLERGEAMKLKDLNASFTDPRKVSIAYFEASLLVEHIVTAYGEAGLHKLLFAFGEGLDTDQALKRALNTSFDEMQVGFDQALERQFGAMRRAMAVPGDAPLDGMDLPLLRKLAADNPRSFPVQMAFGRAVQKAGDLDEATAAFERAVTVMPLPSGADSPHQLMAAIALQKKDNARAMSEFQALVAVDFDNVEAPRRLAALFKEAGVTDPAKTRPVFERIVALDPYDADAHAALGRLAMARGDAAVASREFRAVVALNPVDLALAFTDLAESYFKAGRTVEAKKQTLAALEIAPTYERAQDLLLKLADARR